MNKLPLVPDIRIADTQFAHGTGLGFGDLPLQPKYFRWVRTDQQVSNMIFITESMIEQVDSFPEAVKIAWLIEPMSIDSKGYDYVRRNLNKFTFVLSHSWPFIDYLNQHPQNQHYDYQKVHWFPFGGCWIKPEDRNTGHYKNKRISIIASDKKETRGHQLRHEIIAEFRDKYQIDVYGRGYNPVKDKLEALGGYHYSIVVENERTEGFFTEKLIDCFMTGTMPIYWGDPEIEKHFNMRGLAFTSLKHLDELLSSTPFLPIYDSLTGELNFRAAQAFCCPEDWIYLNFLKPNGLLP
jgi:hypothetical protein